VPLGSTNGGDRALGAFKKPLWINGLVARNAETFPLDHHLREMGVGDLAVPKQIKRMMEAFYGRARSYGSALAAHDPEALARALARNVFAGDTAGGVAQLAGYVRRAAGQLDTTDSAQLLRGLLAFPEPHAILADDAATRA
jgi:cytochrome b pre-mRNA-processing protein 3